MLKQQQAIYHPLGIQVSLAKQVMNDSTRTVGLRFALGPRPDQNINVELPTAMAVVDDAVAVEDSFLSKSGDGLSASTVHYQQPTVEERLVKLEKIKHLLSEEEYKEKRKEILEEV